MIYLNEPEAGGATRFKAIDKIVQPETGKLLAWDNRRPDGSLNAADTPSRHESAQRHEIRHHEMVSGTPLGLVTLRDFERSFG